MFQIISEIPDLPKIESPKELSIDKIQSEFDKIKWINSFQLAGEIFDNNSGSSSSKAIPHFTIINTETKHRLILTIARNEKLEEKILAMHNWETAKSNLWGLFKSTINNGSGRLLSNEVEAKEIIDLFLNSNYAKLETTLEEQMEI